MNNDILGGPKISCARSSPKPGSPVPYIRLVEERKRGNEIGMLCMHVTGFSTTKIWAQTAQGLWASQCMQPNRIWTKTQTEIAAIHEHSLKTLQRPCNENAMLLHVKSRALGTKRHWL